MDPPIAIPIDSIDIIRDSIRDYVHDDLIRDGIRRNDRLSLCLPSISLFDRLWLLVIDFDLISFDLRLLNIKMESCG